MRASHGLLLVVAVVVLLVASCTIAPASTKCVYSFEVWNNSFQPADGFHVFIGGVSTQDLDTTGFWNPNYPTRAVSDEGGGVRIDWSGATIPVGGSATFGFTLLRTAPMDSMRMSWTKEGAQYCLIPSVWQSWTPNAGTMRATVANGSGQSCSIRRIGGFNYSSVTCADLAAMEYPWNSVWMDNPSLQLASGASAVYDFTDYSGMGSYLMYYDLFNGSGGDWIRFRNAAVIGSDLGLQFSKNVPINDHYWYPGFGPSSHIPMLSANASSTSQEGYRIASLDLQMSRENSAEAGSATIDVWIDANGNGEVDSATDTHVGSGAYPGSDQPLAISLSPEVNIPAGGTVPLLITCTLASQPPQPGSRYGFDLWNAEAYAVPSGDTAYPPGCGSIPAGLRWLFRRFLLRMPRNCPSIRPVG